MTEADIHVGDRLRIREWGDMEAERGESGLDGIPGIYVFTSGMTHLCGAPFTVKEIFERDGHSAYVSEENVEYEEGMNGINRWLISADMLEPYPCAAFSPAEVGSFADFITGN